MNIFVMLIIRLNIIEILFVKKIEKVHKVMPFCVKKPWLAHLMIAIII